jgi:glycerophosphoryl diester phosphodiesterase
MPEILAHRGNLTGPAPVTENTLPAIEACVSRGWGVEIDIRRDAGGRFYISHDARPADADAGAGASADATCACLRAHPDVTVALNIKELGYEEALLRYLHEQQVARQVFLFDAELIEPEPGATARLLRRLDPHIRLAARVSDRREPVERALGLDCTTVIWLDEFDRQWASARDVRRLKNQGRSVYAVSPELHGYSFDVARRRWEDFIRWEVDGICTDYPAALAHTIRRVQALPA